MSIPIDQLPSSPDLDRRSPLPKYHQMKEILKSWISSGRYSPQDRFPSERELEAHFKVSRMTIRRAVTELVEEGYLYREQGRGCFIACPRMEHELGRLTSFTEDMRVRSLHSTARILSFGVVKDGDVASRLGVPDDQELIRLVRVRSILDTPAALQTAYILRSVAFDLADGELVDGSLYKTLEGRYGLRIGHAEQTIESRSADEHEARLLGIRCRTPVLALERLTYLHNGIAFEFVRSAYRGDKYRFTVALRR